MHRRVAARPGTWHGKEEADVEIKRTTNEKGRRARSKDGAATERQRERERQREKEGKYVREL